MSRKNSHTAPKQTETTTVEPTAAPDTVRVHYADEAGELWHVEVLRGTERVEVGGGHLVIMWGDTLPITLLSATFVPAVAAEPAAPAVAPPQTESPGRRYVVVDVTGADDERVAALLTEIGATLIAAELPTSPRALVALIECLDQLSPIADDMLGAAKDALARKIGTGKTVQIGGRRAFAAKMSGKARRHEWTMRYEVERQAMSLDLGLDI